MTSKICSICETGFTPKGPYHKFCCHRCAYIAKYLKMPAAKNMTRDEAIAYYGAKFDDPLKSMRASKHRALIQIIMDYCHDKGDPRFTHREIAKLDLIKMHSQSVMRCARDTNLVRKTGVTLENKWGGPVVEYIFLKELL